MSAFRRYISLGEESTYGTPATPELYLDLAGENLKRRLAFGSIQPERHVAAARQSDRGRSVAGSVDTFLSYIALVRMLRWLCSAPTQEDLGDGAWQDTFTPDPHFRPPGLTARIPRDIEVHRYTGLFFSSARLSFGMSDRYFGLSLQCLGADEEPDGSAPDVPASVFHEPAHILHPTAPTPIELEISDGSTTWDASAESVDLNFSWNRKLRQPERSPMPVGVAGGGVVSASAKIKWIYGTDSDFLLDALRSRADVSVKLTIQGDAIGSERETLEVWFPTCRVNGDPPTLRGPGAGNIDFSIDFEPLADPEVGYPFRFRVVYGPFEDELLANPGAENGITGWTQAVGSNWVATTIATPGNPGPHSGSYYFFPGAGASAELRQDVAIPAVLWPTVDTGVQQFRASGWTACADQVSPDSSRLVVEYRDAAGSVLSSWDTGELTTTSWFQSLDTRFAPVGTRTIRFRLISLRHTGTDNNGYYDDLSLVALRPWT